ncbi:MAG: T9SS type A sorting domain-containing protein [Ferruginibacter sp.]
MKNLLFLICAFSFVTIGNAQSTIELLGAPGTGGPSGIGPVTTAQTGTFHSTAATAFSPAVTAAFTLSNQQFTSIEGNAATPGTNFGGGITNTVNSPAPGSNIYDLMNALSGSANTNYTACSNCAVGTGIDITANRSIEVQNYSDALINSAGTQLAALNARVQYADMTITFNRPVSNPMLHFTGLGGQVSYSNTIAGITRNYDLGFTTDVDLLTPGLNWAKISGNAAMTVSATAITNASTYYGAATTPTALHGITRSAATGTVQVNGSNITTITVRFFLHGDGGIIVNNAGTPIAASNGNIVRWGFHAGFIPGGSAGTLIGVSGDGFLVGLSLQQPVSVSGNVFNDPNAGNVNNSTGSANAVPAGLNANLVDANGRVVASVPVATDGTYSFPAIFEGTYTVSLSTTVGTQGLVKPVESVPAGWLNTGEFNGTPNTGADGSVNGISAAFNVTTTNVTNINFGIERLPESAVNSQPGQVNPGGTNNVSVPASAFTLSNVGPDPNTGDYDGGTVTSIRITGFPTFATSITINGTTYTAGTFPPGGVIVPYTTGVGPTQAISIDPVDGIETVVIPFAAIDNGGAEDSTPGSVSVPFTSVLSVRSLEVSVTLTGNKALVRWASENEINTNRFEVERSIDGRRYVTVGIRAAAGDYTGIRNYELTDDMAGLSGVVYYRVKLLNNDARVNYSDVVTLHIPAVSVTLSPNPFTDKIKVNFPGLSGENLTVQITDASGRMMKQLNKVLLPGESGFEITGLDKLPKGNYMIKITGSTGLTLYVQKLVKR